MALILGPASWAESPSTPTVVNAPLEKAYVPVGFDDNDNVQIMAAGKFANTCLKVGPARTVVDHEHAVITVWHTAYEYSGNCVPMEVSFTSNLNVGLVPEGDYEIIDGTSRNSLGQIHIDPSKSVEADEFLYAPLFDAFVLTTESSLLLVGNFSDACTTMKEVRVNYHPGVVVVQPIVKRPKKKQCVSTTIPFVETVKLDSSLKGTQLLHVRSMNGQAINKVVHFEN